MSLKTYTLTAPEQYVDELRVRNLRLIRLRWLYLTLNALVGLGILAIAGTPPQKKLLPIAFLVLGEVLLLNTLLWYRANQRLKTRLYFQTIAIVQVLLDLAIASIIVYTYSQGGGIGRASILYAVPIVATCILFGQTFVYLTAALCGLAYALTSLLYFWLNPLTVPFMHLIPLITFYPIAFLIIAAISAYLSRINQKEIKQESYDELLATLTHQLRRPASTIAAAVEMLEHTPAEIILNDDQKRNLEIIKEENTKALSMLTNFIESGRVTSKRARSHTLETIDLTKLLQETATYCAQAAERPQDLNLKLPNKPVNIQGNPEQLPIAFSNLITNSFQYSPAGTEVTVELVDASPALAVHIVDHGKGMTKQEQTEESKNFLAAIENPILTPSTKVGIGLYVSKRIIDYHGGKLIFESEPNKGTRVIIMFKRRNNV